MTDLSGYYNAGTNTANAVNRANERRLQTQQQAQNQAVELAKHGYGVTKDGQIVPLTGSAEAQRAQEIAFMQQQQQNTDRILAMEQTRAMIDEFNKTGDANIFNIGAKLNPNIADAWNSFGINAIDNINYDSDGGLLQQNGYDYEPGSEELRKAYGKTMFKAYNAEAGTWGIMPVDVFAGLTGTTEVMNNQQQTRMLDNFENVRAAFDGIDREHTNVMEESAAATAGINARTRSHEAANVTANQPAADKTAQARLNESNAAVQTADTGVTLAQIEERDIALREKMEPIQAELDKLTADVRTAENEVDKKRIQNEVDRLAYDLKVLDHERNKLALEQEKVEKGYGKGTGGKTPVSVAKANAANTAAQELVQEFGGADEYFNTDFSEPTSDQSLKALPYIEMIESNLAHTQLSESEKRQAAKLATMARLFTSAVKIGPKDTGFLSAFVKRFSAYAFEGATEQEARAALNHLYNIFRHSLYGAQVTKQENINFIKALGSSNQKLGPVLSKMLTGLQGLDAEMASMLKAGNPYVMHYRIGGTAATFEQAKTALQVAIRALSAQVEVAGDADEMTKRANAILKQANIQRQGRPSVGNLVDEVQQQQQQQQQQRQTPTVPTGDRPSLDDIMQQVQSGAQ